MGYAAIAWFERGERVTADRLKEMRRKLSVRLTESLKGHVAGSVRAEKVLEAEVEAALEAPLEEAEYAPSR